MCQPNSYQCHRGVNGKLPDKALKTFICAYEHLGGHSYLFRQLCKRQSSDVRVVLTLDQPALQIEQSSLASHLQEGACPTIAGPEDER